jgi:hypothetical protein
MKSKSKESEEKVENNKSDEQMLFQISVKKNDINIIFDSTIYL